MKKRIISFILALVLCFSINVTAFASEATGVNYDNTSISITVADKNGNDKQYTITEGSEIEIPLYAAKKATEETTGTQALTQVATLSFTIAGGLAYFNFKPTSIAISALTLGFTGTFTTYLGGTKYGYNSYLLPVGTGYASASSTGTASLSGAYSVIGYETVAILQAYSW